MNKYYMHNLASALKNDTHKLLLDFDLPNLGQKTRPYNSKKSKVGDLSRG